MPDVFNSNAGPERLKEFPIGITDYHTTPPPDSLGRGYPRPQLVRTAWVSLNGPWDFAIDRDGEWQAPGQVTWNSRIQVPFAPEVSASGVATTAFFQACWYRRRIELPVLANGARCHLHFAAVDYDATVWINGRFAGTHRGGYTPFTIDLTDQAPSREIELVVRAQDDPYDLAKPRGKQDWQREPHSIWYTRTTGIWQTVWMEVLPSCSIASIRWTPNLERWEIGVDVTVSSVVSSSLRLHLRLAVLGAIVADDTYVVIGGEVHRRIALSDPGIDDYRNALLWSPESPTIIDAELVLFDDEEAVDHVSSYTALRTIAVQRDRVVLNNRPYPLRLVLDQGYWPDTGTTAPDDAALCRDVELAKAMGFNGVRKHQKIEDPRYLYWADMLGLLVWAEMPSAYRFTQASIERVTVEWMAVLTRDYSHPCVVAWVPINESWGVPNLPQIPAEQHYVRALYHLTHTLDPTRPVIGNDGWESVATDIIGIHDYDSDPDRLARRYGSPDEPAQLFRRERPGGRILLLDTQDAREMPVVLSEFGGIALGTKPGTWGYSEAESADELLLRYQRLLEAVHTVSMFSGFCYTQFADTYQEVNGLLFADRRPKCDLERIRLATCGHFGNPPPEITLIPPAAGAVGPVAIGDELSKPEKKLR